MPSLTRFADRVCEITTTTGTGTLTLQGAAAQYQGFYVAIGNGNTSYYTILSGDNINWESGVGVVSGPSGSATLNPAAKAANAVLSNYNLTVTTTPVAYSAVLGTLAIPSGGKYYFEVTINSVGGSTAFSVGIANSSVNLNNIPGNDSFGVGYSIFDNNFRFNGSANLHTLGTASAGGVLCVAVDTVNKNMWIKLNAGNWNGVITDNPVSNTGGLNGATFFNGLLNTLLSSSSNYPMLSVYNNSSGTINYGASVFSQPIPAGFAALQSVIGYNSLTRAQILSSSNSGNAISLSGTSTVFCSAPAIALQSATNSYQDFSVGVPPLSAFTQIGMSGSASVAQSGRSIVMTDTGTNTLSLHGLSIAAPASTPYRVAIFVQATMKAINYSGFSYGFTDGTKFRTVNWQSNYSAGASFEEWSTSTSRVLNTGINIPQLGFGSFWLGLRDDGTIIHIEYSADGVNFIDLATETKSGGYLSNYNSLFVGLMPDAAATTILTIRCWDVNGLTRSFP